MNKFTAVCFADMLGVNVSNSDLIENKKSVNLNDKTLSSPKLAGENSEDSVQAENYSSEAGYLTRKIWFLKI